MNRDHFRTARTLVNLRQGRNDWYRIAAKADGPVQAMIYDEIGYFGVTAEDFVNDLSQTVGPIELHINSPGGEIFAGKAIYNYLAQRGGVSINIDSLAASAASFIAQAADPGKLTIAKAGSMMIHDGMGVAVGNAADMRELADLLDKESDTIAGIYADRSGRTVAEIRDLMRAETWFNAKESVDAGLADAIQGQPGERAPSNDWDLSVFRQPGPAPANASVDNSPWDAAKAWHNGATSDDPAAFYAGICAGKKAGDKSTQAGWALPYKYTPSSPPNAAGVRNALSRLPQTDGLTNESEAQALLERLMKQINPDYDPGDSWDVDAFQTAFKEAVT